MGRAKDQEETHRVSKQCLLTLLKWMWLETIVKGGLRDPHVVRSPEGSGVLDIKIRASKAFAFLAEACFKRTPKLNAS